MIASTDYSPFGVDLNGRSFSSSSYKYGFNGMEKDNEVKPGTGTSDGNSYTTEFRQYDPRLGRWLSLDPVFKPWESQYAAFANNPILIIDPSGLDGENSNTSKKQPPANVEGQIERKAEAKIKSLKILIESHKKVLDQCKNQMIEANNDAVTYMCQKNSLKKQAYEKVVAGRVPSPELVKAYFEAVTNEAVAIGKYKSIEKKYNKLQTKIWDYENQLAVVYSLVPIRINEPDGGGTGQEEAEGFTSGGSNPTVGQGWGFGTNSGYNTGEEKKKDGVEKIITKPVFKVNKIDSNYNYYEVHHIYRVTKNGVTKEFDTTYLYYQKDNKVGNITPAPANK